MQTVDGLLNQVPELLQRMLQGNAAPQQMEALATLYTRYGIATTKVPETLIPHIDLQFDPENSSHWRRFSSAHQPIDSYPIAGNQGEQGAVVIYSFSADSCAMTEYSQYLAPPHYHLDVAHLTLVTHGAGFFLIEAETIRGKHIVKVPVKRGDLALIPANVIHTFYVTESPFAVISFTTNLIASDTPEFLVVANEQDLRPLPIIEYSVWVAMKKNDAQLCAQGI